MRRVALCTLAFLAACGGKVFVDSPSGASTTTGTTVGAGGSIGGSGGEGGSGGGVSCYDCACTYLVSQGGCADLCTMGLNGTTIPNFCDGNDGLPQCDACIAQACGQPDAAYCSL